MVVVAILGFVVVNAVFVITSDEFAEGLVWLWVFQIAPAIFLVAVFLGAIFLVHDRIKAKRSGEPTS